MKSEFSLEIFVSSIDLHIYLDLTFQYQTSSKKYLYTFFLWGKILCCEICVTNSHFLKKESKWKGGKQPQQTALSGCVSLFNSRT